MIRTICRLFWPRPPRAWRRTSTIVNARHWLAVEHKTPGR